MPYQINKFNGERLVILEDGTLDSTTNINLVGKNFAGYGETQNENFVWLLENFASGIAPGKPLTGQIWYDTVTKKIKVYSGSTWNFVGGTKLSATEPIDPSEGDGWYDSDDGKFYVYDGTDFKFIGPETVAGFGNTRHVSDKIVDSLGNNVPVIKTLINDSVVAITADRSFNPLTPITGFTSFVKGINFSSTSVLNGNVSGNAGSANVLSTARNINGVSFNGSTDVTVKASTTNKLIAGNYITGSDFDGSAPITWTLDASSNNVQDTVVVRDSSGNFAANTVVANLTGNSVGTHTGPVVGGVTGNVIGNLTGNVLGNVTGDVTGNVTGSLTGSLLGNAKGSLIAADNSVAYDGNTKIFTGTFTGNATSATRLQNEIMINNVPFTGQSSITVFDNTKFPSTGGTLLGPLILAADPNTGLGAATKQYVDDRDQIIKNEVIALFPTNYTITYGNTQYSTTGYTNQVGSFNNGANFFDVYPPAGKTMTNLKAFIPSIAVIHYAGGVDGNDSLRCTWSNLGDRIRVWVQNTEQRSTPAANWLAIWS
jgi:outer membrane lipoprotein SlyB